MPTSKPRARDIKIVLTQILRLSKELRPTLMLTKVNAKIDTTLLMSKS